MHDRAGFFAPAGNLLAYCSFFKTPSSFQHMASPAPIRIHRDQQTRLLYSTDASMYEELPEGVAFPKSAAQFRELVLRAKREQFSITARAAGTSLAGQATTGSVVADISRHMNQRLHIDPEERTARVDPGVIRDTLNREAAKYGLLFAPDTATTNRCMIGGMIANNSCGSFSIKYGTTRDHILEIDTVLSDGSEATFKPLAPDELEEKKQLDSLEGRIYRGMLKIIEEHRSRILEAYPHPEIIRRNTGYALDQLCSMQPFVPEGRPFNLAELLCGSEGTLAMITSAVLNLEPVDPHRLLLVPHFRSIREAMKATVEAVKHDPAAVELVDRIILDATKDNIEQRKNRFFLEGEPEAILIIQFDGNEIDSLTEKARSLKERLQELDLGQAFPMIVEEEKIGRVWELRKAGLGLLMGLGAEERSPSFCEDTAVRVQDLPDYVEEFQQLLDRYETNCVFYAHASVGELHLRPVIDTKTHEGVEKMKAMAEEVAELVAKYGGSLSGEHGDGRARSPYIEKVLGIEMLPILQQVKELWDPDHLFNPGKIVDPKPIDRQLRYSPGYSVPAVETEFGWHRERGFENAIELCNGAGVCRKLAESGGTMCPSYMVTREEKDSTRGRANLFRQLFSGRGRDAFGSEELYDALDLCISCKGCKSECPANVDMARMKAEFMQGWHEQNGISLSERFFGEAARFYPLAAILPEVTNRLIHSPVGKELMKQFFNVHPARDLPSFAPETFGNWFNKREDAPQKKNLVVLLVDLFTNYHEPQVGKAAVQFLEQSGYRVIVPEILALGRTQLSKGLVKKAKVLARKYIPRLAGWVDEGLPIIGLEPSELLTLRDEYPDLCGADLRDAAQAVAENSFLFEEFAAGILEDRGIDPAAGDKVYLHGHCHAKALVGMEPTRKSLELAGYQPVELDTGCCGMAGSFGYEADHYEISMNMGELALFPALRETDEDALICAPGFSCRHQIRDGTGRKAYHPAELIARKV